MTGEAYTLAGLSITLLGVLITSTWKFASLATELTSSVSKLEERHSDLSKRHEPMINEWPSYKSKIDHIEKNHSYIPNLVSKVAVLETKVQHSKEMRQARISRPDVDESDEG